MEINETIYNKNLQVKRDINKQYDLETEHGKINGVQKEWEKKIALELKSLSKYASPKVVKRFKK